MWTFDRRLLLYCDALNCRFTLTEEGGEWRKVFDTFEDAYEYAETCALHQTQLLVFNELGRFILEAELSPFSSTLRIARNHWRNMAAMAEVA
jgi:hypothetical protein